MDFSAEPIELAGSPVLVSSSINPRTYTKALVGMTDRRFRQAADAGEAGVGEGAHSESPEQTTGCSEDDSVMGKREVHDLLFHAHSRLGRHDDPSGATFRFGGEIEHEPLLQRAPEGRSILLYRPELADILASDMPLTAELESRRSIRHYADKPLSDYRMGERLYCTVRVRAVFGIDGDAVPFQGTDRPYLTGGAAGDLEIYLMINRCDGLGRAIYYYGDVTDVPVLMNADAAIVETPLGHAYNSTARQTTPDVLLTVAALPTQ